MASGSYAKKPKVQATTEVRSAIPARATRDLSATGENAAIDTVPLTETFTFSRESAPLRTPVETEKPNNRTRTTNKNITTDKPTTSTRTTNKNIAADKPATGTRTTNKNITADKPLTSTRTTNRNVTTDKTASGTKTTAANKTTGTRTTTADKAITSAKAITIDKPTTSTRTTATKNLPAPRVPYATQVLIEEEEPTANTTRVLEGLKTPNNTRILPATKINRAVDIDRALTHDTPPIKPLEKHKPWLNPWLICFTFAIISLLVLISAGMFQRVNTVNFNFGVGQTYSIQVGGSQAQDWQKAAPAPIQPSIKHSTGPYAVMGKPTISAAFINKVLANANSPAAGKGQVFYDMGVQYGIDPVFALAFFQHESTFGTKGEARKTLSIGNLRCIQNHACVDQNASGDGYAQMDSWDDGIKTWYSLIRNLYVIELHKDTIEKIIPTYAPNSDNNDEAAYISSLKYSIDRWRSGII
ncbi:glucosaminidase domain-containing protein [Dictyobacter kobayashii]|uniref:Mannosyl-glycoprotein endo-beta-N-acetylglucosamidase-like domain-containing protein n=1 Tax=Dictyobacter kobayashii TaxID=2014872 RepID=A0A402AIB2_9CHLR|nr:glucosaminidase domain-containing protein [Dictyobacter kobayashii]GCE18784.1 hypothetical protein KDK_25840 [Dictyobacter kobayashii]